MTKAEIDRLIADAENSAHMASIQARVYRKNHERAAANGNRLIASRALEQVEAAEAREAEARKSAETLRRLHPA